MHFSNAIVLSVSALGLVQGAPISKKEVARQIDIAGIASSAVSQALGLAGSATNQAGITIVGDALNGASAQVTSTTKQTENTIAQALSLNKRGNSNNKNSKGSSSSSSSKSSKAPANPPNELPDPVTAGPSTGSATQDAANLLSAFAGEGVKDGGIFANAASANGADALKNPKKAGVDASATANQASFQLADAANDVASLLSDAANDSVADGLAGGKKSNGKKGKN